MRLSKYLSQIGVASRRSIDKMIEEGRISVNGKKAILGQLYEKNMRITIDQQPLAQTELPEEAEFLLCYKPSGVVCTHSDEQGRQTLLDLIKIKPKSGKWIMVGRLDLQSTGLILFTNKGDLATKLMHPSTQIERVYEVKVQGIISAQNIEQLKNGIQLEDGLAKAKSANLLETTGVNSWIRMSLTEGKNREIRRMMEKLNFNVLKLRRIMFGPIKLDSELTPGDCRKLTKLETDSLLKFLDKNGARRGT